MEEEEECKNSSKQTSHQSGSDIFTLLIFSREKKTFRGTK